MINEIFFLYKLGFFNGFAWGILFTLIMYTLILRIWNYGNKGRNK